jgi:hypothetical protein
MKAGNFGDSFTDMHGEKLLLNFLILIEHHKPV